MRMRHPLQRVGFAMGLFVLMALAPNVGFYGAGELSGPANVETGPLSTAVTAADINGDGKNDVIVSTLIAADDDGPKTLSIGILLGVGEGRFASLALAPFVERRPGQRIQVKVARGQSLAAGDLNGDGHIDLAIANPTDNGITVLTGDGKGGFPGRPLNLRADKAPWALAVADMNGDGRPDILAVNVESRNISVLLNEGRGRFADSRETETGNAPLSLTVADLNGDGKLDAAIAVSGAVSILLGDGAGSFQRYKDFGIGVSSDSPIWVSSGDVNSDGKLDLVTANLASNTVSVLINEGSGNFAEAQTTKTGGLNPSALAVRDFSGDGKLDIAVAHGASHNVTLLIGDGAGSFSAGSAVNVGSIPASLVATDLDGDGDLDLATANQGSDNISILTNR